MPTFTGIAMGVGAAASAGGLLSGLFGGGSDSSGMEDAYMNAANMQQQSTREGQALMEKMYQQARADVAPWRDSGGKAVNWWEQALDPNSGLDLSARLAATPGYGWLQSEGEKAQQRAALTRGMDLSGAQLKGLTSWNQQNALTNAYTPYMANLQALSGQGLQAGGLSGNWAMQSGQQQGQMGLAGAQAQAAGLVNAANANMASNQSGQNNMMQALGLTGGLARTALGSTGSDRGFEDWFGGTPNTSVNYGNIGSQPGMDLNSLYNPSTPWAGNQAFNASSSGGWVPAINYYKGGPIPAGRTAMVGEKGPELFIPTQPGYIIPNYALGGNYNNYRPAWG